MEKDVTPYIEKADEVFHILQKDGLKRPAYYAVVIGLVAAKVVEAVVENNEDKQELIDAICWSVERCSE